MHWPDPYQLLLWAPWKLSTGLDMTCPEGTGILSAQAGGFPSSVKHLGRDTGPRQHSTRQESHPLLQTLNGTKQACALLTGHSWTCSLYGLMCAKWGLD